MNDEGASNRIKIEGARPIVFIINASERLNSEIAMEFASVLENQMIDFLIPLQEAQESLIEKIPEYNNATSADTQIFYENPYLQTQELVTECIELTYTRKEQTGAIVILEQGNNRKDRYTSVSYGNHFACLLE